MPQVAAGNLSDGRIQVWLIDQQGTALSRWKVTTDPNAGWTNWSPFPTPSGTVAIATAPLEDGRCSITPTPNTAVCYWRQQKTHTWATWPIAD